MKSVCIVECDNLEVHKMIIASVKAMTENCGVRAKMTGSIQGPDTQPVLIVKSNGVAHAT